MPEIDPAPCTGAKPDGATLAHCRTCYRQVLPFDAGSIRPRWRVIEARDGHPGAAVCLSHVDRHALRHLHTIARPDPITYGGLVSRVTASLRKLFRRWGGS